MSSLIPTELAEILRCTECREPITEDVEARLLRCSARPDEHTFPVDDLGIPDMRPLADRQAEQ